MTEIDVTDNVLILDTDPISIKCVCGGFFYYSLDSYDKNTRKLWTCPACKAELYFKDVADGRCKIVQVIDEKPEG